MRSWFWCLAALLVACGGQGTVGVVAKAEDLDGPSGGSSAGASAEQTVEPELSAAELGGTWQELALPGPGQVEAIARVPDGFLALRRESVGAGKVGLFQSHLYASADGVSWSEIPLETDHQNFGLRGLAYAHGRYVMAGDRYLWTSADGRTWSEQVMAWNDGSTMAGVVVSNERFFVLGTFRRMLTSADGTTWAELDLTTLQQTGVAFGGGKYVLTGSGPIQSSTDGLSWQSSPLDCSLPDACISDPDGNVAAGYYSSAFYLGGHFYTGALVSDDGVAWRASSEPYPLYQAGAYLFGAGSEAGSLRAWQPGNPAIDLAVAPASEGNAGLASGESCASHRCVLLDARLFLLR